METATESLYYYQVETQMMVCKVPHCDFVAWTEKELAVERIVADRVLQPCTRCCPALFCVWTST